MSNRIKDRYTTAQDFADDLWYFVNAGPGVQGVRACGPASAAAAAACAIRPGPARRRSSGAWTSSGSSSDKGRAESRPAGRDSMTSSRRRRRSDAGGSARTLADQPARRRSGRRRRHSDVGARQPGPTTPGRPRSSPRACARSTITTPTSSSNSCPARATATACRTSFAFGNRGSRTSAASRRSPWASSTDPRAAARRR